MKVYLPTDDQMTRALFVKHGYKIALDPEEEGIAAHVFVGGADVHPFLYGDKVHRSTFTDFKRDRREAAHYRTIPAMMPKIGICRGAQFLNVMSGGRLWQDVDGHGRTHEMKVVDPVTKEEEFIEVTSTHHQMMIPLDDACTILGTSKEASYKDSPGLYVKYQEGGHREWDDIEAVEYWTTMSLCCQFHPEYAPESKMAHWFMKQVNRMTGKK